MLAVAYSVGGEESPIESRESVSVARDGERAAWRATLVLVAIVTAVHAAVAASVGLGTDEAHYALYGLHLDWSYFDHPPLVGWLQALALEVADTDLALRAFPLLLFMGSCLALHRLTRRLFPDESPWLGTGAVVWLLVGLPFHALGMSMLPEAPLLLVGLGAMHALLGVLERGRLIDWLLLGVLLGLAGLSKYTAVTLVVTVAGAVLLERPRPRLAAAGPLLALLVAALAVLPVLLWNQAHDWISVRYQLEHGAGDAGWSLTRCLVSQAVSLAAYSPAVYVFGLVALVAGWRERSQRGVRLTLLLAWPMLVLFGVSGGGEVSLPHWTALAWAGTAPLGVRWVAGAWHRAWVRALAWTSGGAWALLLLVIHSQLLVPWMPFPENKDPTTALHGWDEAADEARRQVEKMATTEGRPPHLFVDGWTRASRIAWYARPEPVVVLDNSVNQFDLWFGSPVAGDRGILVVWDREGDRELPGDLRSFDHTELVSELPIHLAGRLATTFRFYACDGYREPRQRSSASSADMRSEGDDQQDAVDGDGLRLPADQR